MKFIKFGTINKKFLIPIFGGIVMLVYELIIIKIPKFDIIAKNPFIMNIYVSLGMIFAVIPFIILKHRSKSSPNTETQIESKLKIELIYNELFLDNSSLKIKLILASTIFDFFQVLLFSVFCGECVYNLWIFDIILMSLFSYLILKTKLYNHQFFSMFIIIILGFMLNIIEYFKLDDEDKKLNFFELFMKFLCEACLSIDMVINKYNMVKTYCSPFVICFYQGLLELILNIISLVIINISGVVISDIKYPDNFYEFLIIMIYMILFYVSL